MTVCMLLQMMPPIQFTSCNVLHIYIRYIDYILYVCYIKLPWHVTTYFMYTFLKPQMNLDYSSSYTKDLCVLKSGIYPLQSLEMLDVLL